MCVFDCGRKHQYLQNIQTPHRKQGANPDFSCYEGSDQMANVCVLPQIVKECNEGVRKMSRTEELINIEKKLEFKCKVNQILCHLLWIIILLVFVSSEHLFEMLPSSFSWGRDIRSAQILNYCNVLFANSCQQSWRIYWVIHSVY